MLIGEDLQHAAGLQALSSSDLAVNWLEAYHEGWGTSELQALVKSAEDEGLASLPIPTAHRMMLVLLDEVADVPRRTEQRTGVSLAEAQTVDRLATAAWADQEDFAERYAFKPGAMWINRDPLSGKALGMTDDRHMGVFCQTRGGKGVSFIIPQHALWAGSIVSIDPSGENATIMAMARGDGRNDEGVKECIGRGQQTHVLDPLHTATVPKKYRKRFNPLDALDPDDPKFIEKAAALADAFIVRPETENEPVWNNKARTLIKGLILHICTAQQFKGRSNLVTLRDLVTMGDVYGAARTEKITGVETNPWTALFFGMEKNRSCGNVIPAIGAEFMHLVEKDIDKQWAGIHSAATDQTEFLESPLIQECLAASDFDLRDLKDHPDGCSLFLCLPEGDMDTYKGWVRMMLYLIDYELRRTRGNGATGKPVLLCIDEFAALDTMDRIGKGMSNIAKYGGQYLLILQSIEQLQSAYPKSWNTIMGCMGVKLFAAVEDTVTAKWVSERCGETDLVLLTENRSLAKSTQQSIGKTWSNTTGTGGSESTTHTAGSSTTDTEGKSSSNTRGSSKGRTFGSSLGNSFGTSTSQSRSRGESNNESYDDTGFGQTLRKNFRLWREKSHRSIGKNSGTTQGSGTNKGKTASTNQSKTTSTNQSSTEGKSSSKSNTQQKSTAKSTSKTWQASTTEGGSATNSEGETLNKGTSDTHHKRPLMTPDEVMRLFARGQQGDVYGLGLGLVLVSGERPMLVERTTYYEDPVFEGRWGFNPAYPQTRPAPVEQVWEFGFAIKNDGPLWAGGADPIMGNWFKQPGDRIEQGEPIGDILPGPTVAGFTDNRLPMLAPVTGVMQRINRQAGEPFEGYAVLCSIAYDLGEQESCVM